MGALPLAKVTQHFCLVGLGDWVLPSNGAPSAWTCLGQPLVEVNIHPTSLGRVCLGIFWSGLGFSTAGSHLGISLTSRGPGPPVLAAARALPADGAAYSFHLFFKHYDCCQGPLVGIPCYGHHFLI